MPITQPTAYAGSIPALSDPTTFDARMTTYVDWFTPVVTELAQMVDDLNDALNGDETVLAATAQATRRATNAVAPALTTGSGTAYVVSATSPIPALALYEPVSIRTHIGNNGAATLNVDGLGAIAMRKVSDTLTLVPLTGGELSAAEEHVFIFDGSFWVMATQPLREIISGKGLVPLANLGTDFNEMTIGGQYDIPGAWTNGPLGAASQTYNGFAMVQERGDNDGARVTQTVTIDTGSDFQTWQRTGTGTGPTWRAWRRIDGAVGLSQTWQPVTPSRTVNTVYQNTTGKAIQVAISGVINSATPAYGQVSASSAFGFIALARSGPGSGGNNMSFIVPPNYYYRLTQGSGTTTSFEDWSELR